VRPTRDPVIRPEFSPARNVPLFGKTPGELDMTRSSFAVVAIAATIALTSVQGQERPATAPVNNFEPGILIVKFSPTLNQFQRNNLLVERSARRLRHLQTLDIDIIQLPPGAAVANAASVFRRLPGVTHVQPNYIRRTTMPGGPNDPFWQNGSLWGLQKIDAPGAWSAYSTGNGSVVLASIDTGVNYHHPDLTANIWHNPGEIPGNGLDDDGNGYVDDVHGIDTVNGDTNPIDDQGHGTHTAGTMAAAGNNALGVVGVNWNAKLLACKFLDASGTGTDAGAIECFDYIVALKNRGVNIRVSNNSWGALRGPGAPAVALEAAIEAAGIAGILNVFGAGNNAGNTDVSPFDPASYPVSSIVSVASSGRTDRRSSFSNYGTASVDLAAPGEDIVSTYLDAGYVAASGTSMAAPHVAGVAGLLASIDPTLSVAALKALLLENVDQSPKWTGKVVSGGRLNAARAAAAVSGVPANDVPVAAITAPVPDATYKAPASVAIAAIASDPDGTVQQVGFYANGLSIGIDTSAPYEVVWNGVAPGTYALTAVAIDDKGATGASAPVFIVVLDNTPPVVSLTSPANDASFVSPASVTVSAVATDPDGTIQQVTFFANNTPIGTDTSAPFTLTWSAPFGSHSLTAVATDNQGATATSTPIAIVVAPIPGRINVARASNGGIATASSTLSANYPASSAIDGDRKGLNWGSGGGWNDGTRNASPDWIEIAFSGEKRIEEINVFSLQDAYTAPIEPVPGLAFSLWGLKAFQVQYWTGADWATMPGGAIENNVLVWRQVAFAPIDTTRIRVHITGALNGYSRVVEVEAWGVSTGANAAPSVAITQPAASAQFEAPATITVSATASDVDGAIQQVEFRANGVAIGIDTTAPFSVSWAGVGEGPYSLTAVATDNQGAETTSAPVSITVETEVVTPPTSGRLNMALAANGGVATASSQLGANYPPAGAINGDRRGLGWGAGGGWNDGTANTSPDWIDVAFSGARTIDEINVFSMQDNYTAPVEPTPTMTFSLWGLRTFEAQYWTGSAWAPVPGAVVTGNTLVWRQFLFSPVTTTRIRIFITAALNGYSRVVEVEAWGVAAANTAPLVAITAPASGAVFAAPATIPVTAAASDSDGTVASVAFFANGGPIGTATTSPFTISWTSVAAGSYSLIAVATDNQGAQTTSTPVSIVVDPDLPPPPPPPARLNVALAVNGGVATASSQLNPNYPPSGAINGDRRGLSWGAGGGWNDGTFNASPDWIEVAFNGSKTIEEVNVFSMQDNFSAPAEPTLTMTFTTWGLRAFEVQYWTGTAWAALPGGTITNNTLVWRQVLFAPVTTTRIRVFVTGALNGYSRVMEVEAWGVAAGPGAAGVATSGSSAADAAKRAIIRSIQVPIVRVGGGG
jgi:subtilisin family serine protease